MMCVNACISLSLYGWGGVGHRNTSVYLSTVLLRATLWIWTVSVIWAISMHNNLPKFLQRCTVACWAAHTKTLTAHFLTGPRNSISFLFHTSPRRELMVAIPYPAGLRVIHARASLSWTPESYVHNGQRNLLSAESRFIYKFASGHVTNCGACTTLLLIPTGRARCLLTQQ